MKEKMYRHLTSLIHECRTWVDVLDSEKEEVFAIQAGGGSHQVRCRVLSLVTIAPRGVYPRGQTWRIPEYRLDKAVRAFKRNEAFKARYDAEAMTAEDAEAIIFHASYKFIRLELDQD